MFTSHVAGAFKESELASATVECKPGNPALESPGKLPPCYVVTLGLETYASRAPLRMTTTAA